MGIYDRDYIRNDRRSSPFADMSMVWKLIAINVAIWFLDLLTDPVGDTGMHWLGYHFALQPNVLTHPWELLTHGFLHDTQTPSHIFWNMVWLWFFGTDVERVYGQRQFLRIYLSILICEGIVWAVFQRAAGTHEALIGASGAIMGITILCACLFPNQEILVMFFLPMPLWVLAAFSVALDVFGVMHPTDNVGHAAHLAGAFFGFLYYRTGWCLASLWPEKLSLPKLRRRPKFRVHREDDEDADRKEPVTRQRVDELLEKISREGESSLTDSERRELEEASRRFRGHQGKS